MTTTQITFASIRQETSDKMTSTTIMSVVHTNYRPDFPELKLNPNAKPFTPMAKATQQSTQMTQQTTTRQQADSPAESPSQSVAASPAQSPRVYGKQARYPQINFYRAKKSQSK